MEKTQKIVILLPLWGIRYITKFLQNGLPSILGQNELEHLSNCYDFHLVFLTTKTGKRLLQSKESFLLGEIRKKIKIIFINIDDIIKYFNNNYGMIISVVYLRGMNAYKHEWKQTVFMYIVGDYVFSNNVFKSLVEKLESGGNVIYSISLRCLDSDLIPYLNSYRTDNKLIIPPRAAISLGLSTLHPSFKVKISSNILIRSRSVQHFYWRVDPNTMIARCLMLHPLAIRPTRWVDQVPGPVDYAFVPAFAPDGPIQIISDSDEGVFLELQRDPKHDSYIFEYGEKNLEDLAKKISTWATDHFLSLRKFRFVLHSSEIPDEIDISQDKADQFIANITDRANTSSLQSPFSHSDWMPYIANGILDAPPEISKEIINNKMLEALSNSNKLTKWTKILFDHLDQTEEIRKSLSKMVFKSNNIILIKNENDCLRYLGKDLYQNNEMIFSIPSILESINLNPDYSILPHQHPGKIFIILPLEDAYLIDSLTMAIKKMLLPENEINVIIFKDPTKIIKPTESFAWVFAYSNLKIDHITLLGNEFTANVASLCRENLKVIFKITLNLKKLRTINKVIINLFKFNYNFIRLLWMSKLRKKQLKPSIQSSRVIIFRCRTFLPESNNTGSSGNRMG